MAKWKLPEGRKPLTTVESADLVLRMHDKLAAGFAAGDQAELLEAARQDAKEAEAYAEELEAKLAKAVEALRWIGTRSIMLDAREDSLRLHARMTLAELKGETDE